MVIYHGFNLSEGVGLGPLLQSGQIQGRQQLTSPKVAEPGYFWGKSRAVYGVSRTLKTTPTQGENSAKAEVEVSQLPTK